MRDPGPAASSGRLAAALQADPARADRDPRAPLEDWPVTALRRRAAENGIAGRSRMRKDELIRALRVRGAS